MQPEAAHLRRRKAQLLQVGRNMFSSHGTHFFKHLASLLHKELITILGITVFATAHKARIVADVVRELGHAMGAQNVPTVIGSRQIGALYQQRGTNITENKVAIAVSPALVGRGNFGVHNQHCTRLATAHSIGRLL